MYTVSLHHTTLCMRHSPSYSHFASLHHHVHTFTHIIILLLGLSYYVVHILAHFMSAYAMMPIKSCTHIASLHFTLSTLPHTYYSMLLPFSNLHHPRLCCITILILITMPHTFCLMALPYPVQHIQPFTVLQTPP